MFWIFRFGTTDAGTGVCKAVALFWPLLTTPVDGYCRPGIGQYRPEGGNYQSVGIRETTDTDAGAGGFIYRQHGVT